MSFLDTFEQQIENFSENTVDKSVEENADFQYQSGLSPKIVRTGSNCCQWCSDLEGTYSYPDVPPEVYARHANCSCDVEYFPGDKTKQNVHTKQIQQAADEELLELRKSVGQAKRMVADIPEMQSTMSPADYKNYMNMLNNNSNADVRGLYDKYSGEAASVNQIPDGGGFSRHSKKIEWDYASADEIADGTDKMATLAHEWSHLFSNCGNFDGITFTELNALNQNVQIGSGQTLLFPQRASNSDQFMEALRKDKELLKKSYLPNKADILAHDSSGGVQDVVSGLFGVKRSGVKWRHEEKYWNKQYNNIKNLGLEKDLKQAFEDLGMDASNQTKVAELTRQYRVAEEAWANIGSAVTCNDAQLKWVETYLPNSYNIFKETIKNAKDI